MTLIDNVTLSIASDTRLEPVAPLAGWNGDASKDLLRLHVHGGDQSVTVWIERSQALRLVAAIVAASYVPLPKSEPETPEPARPQPVEATPF